MKIKELKNKEVIGLIIDVLVMLSVLCSKFSSIETIEGPPIPCSFF